MSTDAIDFLLGQHQAVEKLIDSINSAPPESRGAIFDELRESLAVHETAEELVLRPVTRAAGGDGERIAAERMAEENDAKKVLAELEKMDPTSDGFLTAFGAFSADVLEHATNEEQEEFPLVRRQSDSDKLAKLGALLEKVEKVAPTHPHPSAKSTAANAVLGPFASIVDRARDAIASAIGD